MMYIDQAPLGGNLVNIIKKSASLGNAAATPARESSVPQAKDLNCQDETTNRITTVNGEHSISNGNHQNIAETFNNICKLIKITKGKLQLTDKTLEASEEEDKTGYVLYDIEPDVEESSKNLDEQIHKANFEGDQYLTNGFNSCEQPPAPKKKNISVDIVDTATNSKKRTRTLEAEDDCEEFIVKIKPVPQLQPVLPKSSTKLRRPLPAAIPIADFIAKSEKCVLNKYLSSPVNIAYEHEEPEEHKYRFVQSSSLEEDFEPFEKQMGINIFSNLWKNLFQRSSKTENTEQGTSTVGSKRKRSFGLSQPTTAPPQIKYRRVDNNFPKIITGTLDNDLDDMPASQLRLTNRSRLTAIPQAVAFPNIDMAQRNDNNSIPQRRSLFEYPQKKVVRNTSYADYEFSDDDEDDGRQMRRLKTTLSNFAPKNTFGDGLQQPRVRNIPIQIEQPRPPPMFMSSLPHTDFVDPIRQPTYADVLKQSQAYGAGQLLGRRADSSNNSSGDGASSSRFRINSKGLGGSILRQERAKLEHENYKQLLETVTSRVNRFQSFLYPSSRPQSRSTLLNLASAANCKNKTNLLGSKLKSSLPAHRAPLSSTINIADDDDEDDTENASDEVVVTGISQFNTGPEKSSKRISAAAPILHIDDDDEDDISEIIELNDDDENKVKPKKKTANANQVIDLDAKENEYVDLPFVEPVNTFRDYLQTASLKDDWFQNFNSKWEKKGKIRKEEVGKTVEIAENITSERKACESDLRTRFQEFYIVDPELVGVDDFEKPEPEEVPEFPELNQASIKAAVAGHPDQVLVEKFNLRITRRDIHTLLGCNWLNDEVINFYMSMITDRSERKHETHGYPKVYAMNTFFLQRVLQNGHSGVKRWTRKVDIFEKDVIPVPVHVGGVHWCMAIIHLKNRWIRYYDSMGSPNPNVLKALEQYLKDESLDKRKQPFDTSGFIIESVADVPRQQNGSDCGVFSCMFAEYIARNKPITFEQKHMEYFRHKMILEIVQGELLL